MQSYLQYKKFERQARAQYEHNREKFNPEVIQSATTQATVASQSGGRGLHVRDSALTNGQNEYKVDGARPALPYDKNDPEKAAQEEPGCGPSQEIDHDIYVDPPEKEGAPGDKNENEDDSTSQTSSHDSSGSSTPVNEYPRSDLDRVQTAQSRGVQLGRTMTGIEVRRRTTKEGGPEGGQVFIVDFEGDDDELNPHNWSLATRGFAVLNIALVGWTVGFASAVDSGTLDQAAAYFGVGEVAESLATGLFLIGFGAGGLSSGPLSEEFGRNPVYIATFSLYMIFVMASGLSPNFGAQCAFRFIAGYFAATPLSCAGGSINDLFNAKERVWAFPIFANAAFMGPVLGPVVGSFIGQASPDLEWQWVEWVTLCISGGVLASLIFLQPETYPSTLLRWRAAHLRKITGDDRFRAAVEVLDTTFAMRLKRAVFRPFELLIREPIVLLIGLYLMVIYIILFTFLNGFTFIFGDTYGFSQGITGLMFLGIVVGLFCASILIVPIYRAYLRSLQKAKEEGRDHLPPEIRLRFAMYGAPAVPISMFWMGWTAYPSVSYWSPLVATVLFGYGILTVFISSYQYIMDAYALYAASALAAITFIRYVAAGGMVEVAIPMYKNLGVHWTMTVLGCISLLCTPVPYIFYAYGHKLRKLSKYAQE